MRLAALLLCCALAGLLAGCPAVPQNQAPPEGQKPAQANGPAPAPVNQAAPQTPAPPPTPLPPEEVARILKLVNGLLDQGDEARAKEELTRLLASNPENKQAQSYMRQITTDPAEFFFDLLKTREWSPYTVPSGEKLSNIAKARYNDANLFYVLARYNNILQPNKVAAGQSIKIPGKGALENKPVVAAPAQPASAPPVAPAPLPPSAGEQAMKEGAAAEAKGDFVAAYGHYVRAASYGIPGAQEKVAATRKRNVDALNKEALTALVQAPNDPAKCMRLTERVQQKFDAENETAKSLWQRCNKALCAVNPAQCNK